ncbi:lipocalin family protein [Aquimarina litoralis]|uniref:lipocalin family protein n=1 Tax=Aquimarina litoralis TaxID=584605 RepID=UPI001C591186|nr:lipocalin family protein [Aquimarina litoralis]MBW1296093.1 hypothetical protein [Aquimarina litoralis]
MKKSILTSLMAVIILFNSSCDSDDDVIVIDPVNFETLIIGKWVLTSSTENGEPDSLDSCDLMDYYEFNADNTASYVEHGDTNGVTCQSFDNSGSWSIEGNILTTVLAGASEEETILGLTETTLTLEYVEGDFTYVDTYTKE